MSQQRRPRARAHNGANLLSVTGADCDNYPVLGFDFAYAGVHFTRAEARAMRRLYGFEPPAHGGLNKAGDDRGLMRRAEQDGLRMVAWIAKHCQPGEDPLRKLIRTVVDGGYDVDPADHAWATEVET